jgi:hypothetical protein
VDATALHRELKARYEASPFQPFEIVLGNGRRFRVDVPDHVAWSPTGGTISYANDRDTFDILEMSQVTGIAPAPDGARPKSSGETKRSRRRKSTNDD